MKQQTQAKGQHTQSKQLLQRNWISFSLVLWPFCCWEAKLEQLQGLACLVASTCSCLCLLLNATLFLSSRASLHPISLYVGPICHQIYVECCSWDETPAILVKGCVNICLEIFLGKHLELAAVILWWVYYICLYQKPHLNGVNWSFRVQI